MKYGDYQKFKTSVCPIYLTTYTA